MANETIYALSTPPGRSGVAVIRISGTACLDALKALGVDQPEPRYTALAALKHPDTGEVIDKALAVYFKAPHSFTGEDVVELHVHGSRAVLKVMLEVLSNMKGLRSAEPGEFSKRAFMNEKMDLTQAEGLADLIDAETEMQRKQAVRQMSGRLAEQYEAWREACLKTYALLEAYIDFPDEDIPESVAAEMNEEAAELIATLEKHLNNMAGERVRDGLVAVILGEPNVGKSSLLNALAKRDVAIVSDTAGTTRDMLEVYLDVNGYPLTIIDTAGLREASGDAIEMEGIKRALTRAKEADLKLVMFEADSIDEGHPMAQHVDENSLVVANKVDQQQISAKSLKGQEIVPIAASAGAGLEALVDKLSARISGDFEAASDALYTQSRHKEALNRAREALKEFLENDALPIELRAESVRIAARELGSITGKIEVDEVLGQIFSSFCIGK